MAVSPCSYDFFTFLYSAETCRLRRGLDNVKLIFIQGPKNRFRDDEVRTNEQNETFFDNVVIPGMSLLDSCSSFMWLPRNEASFNGLSEQQIFPRGYRLDIPTFEYGAPALVASLIRGDKHSFLEAPSYAKSLAENLIKNKCSRKSFVTITAREVARDDKNKTRILDYSIWRKAIKKLAEMGIKTFVIRDTSSANNSTLFEGVEELPEVSIHLPLRLALYEKALINFTKNNGPGGLQLYSKARTVYFNGFDDDVIALSKNWFLSNFGMNEGDQFPFTTRSKSCVWNDESENRIIKEVKNALNTETDNALLNDFSNLENIRASLAVGFRHLVVQLQYGLLSEDITLFSQIKKLNNKYNIYDDFDQQLKALSGYHIDQKITEELIAKTSEKQKLPQAATK